MDAEKKTYNVLLMNNLIFWEQVDVKEIKSAKVKEFVMKKVSDVKVRAVVSQL